MADRFLAKATVREQIVKLPEGLQFQAVRQTMELMANKRLLKEQKEKLEQELARMRFVFQETKTTPLIAKKKQMEEAPYVSQSVGEFVGRVLRKTCSKGLFATVLLMAIKFTTTCFSTELLNKANIFLTEHFLYVAGGILVGCMVLSVAEVTHRDRTNTSKLQRLNNAIVNYNRNVDKKNEVIRQKNLQLREADKKRRAAEEKIYLTKRKELQKLLTTCKDAYQKVLSGIDSLRERNVMPEMFFEDGNKMLPIVYYLMQNRITVKLYDLDGALEKARSMLQEEKMLDKVQQIVNNTAQTVGLLQTLNSRMQDVHGKLDSLSFQMSSLAISQTRMNAMLTDVCQSNQDVVAAIESQSNTLVAQNKALAGNIDKSIRENSLGRYVYDTSLFGTHINAKDIKKFVEGQL